MKRTITFTSLLFLVAVASLTTGCDDPKERIALLEQSNQELLDDLNATRDQLLAAQQAADACNNELASTRTENGDLRGRLAALPPEPQVPAGWQSVPGGAMISIDDSILFASGKAELRKEATSTLQHIASVLNSNYGSKDVMVFGHTDDSPIKKSGWDDNYQLSTERALAVVRKLKQIGVSPKRLVACGCGENRPRVPNKSAADRQQNRRVEIFALDAEVRTAQR